MFLITFDEALYFQGPDSDVKRIHNTHVLIDNEGTIRATYEKAHLFDLDLKGRVRLCESDYTVPGKKIVPPVMTPIGRVAMSTVSFRSVFIFNFANRFKQIHLEF